MLNEKELLITAIRAALLAGDEILDVYGNDFTVEYKEDHSPLTMADRRAHQRIAQILKPTGLPVLSEEGKNIPYEERRSWKEFWMVDPLDGTKEFVKRNGEFTVNIALIRGNKAVMGVIFVPVSKWLYFGYPSAGAFKINLSDSSSADSERIPDQASPLDQDHLPEHITVVSSRSHRSAETQAYIDDLKKKEQQLEFVSIGSSLKFCLLADGRAHIYPRFGPTMEWDTAAGQAILENAGGKVIVANSNHSLSYNKEQLLNPWFIAGI